MPPRDALIRHMLDELESLGRLTDREAEVVADLREIFTRSGGLEAEEFKRLNQLYEEKVR